MGLSSKQVTGDQGLDWGQSFSGTAEMSKPPPTRRLQEQLKCPRCASTNTKFCYYNNYNKSQPRHFCKSCKRHWTKGGILRNVPVGGGRKNKRPKTPTVAAAATPPQLDSPNFLFTDVIEEKNTSNILYQAMIQSSSPISHETKSFNNGPPTSTGLNSSEPQNINTEFQFSNLTTFEENSSWANPTSYHQSLNSYYHFTGNIDSLDESIITSINNASTSYDPWVDPDTSSAYWNWNEIDVSGDLNIAWDDNDNDNDNNAEIKP